MAKKTTRKRMSKAPPKKTQAKRDAYALGSQTRPGKAMAQRKARTSNALQEAMSAARSARRKK